MENNTKRNVKSLKIIIVFGDHKQYIKVHCENILCIQEYNAGFFEKTLKFKYCGWDEILEVNKFQI